MKISHQIHIARKKANLTQAQLAEKIHYSTRMVSMVEQETKTPSIKMLQAIANTLDITFTIGKK